MDIKDLINRALEKVDAIGSTDTPSAEDYLKGLSALKSAHYALEGEDLLRWTMSDIPEAVSEPYVLLSSFYMSDEFGVKKSMEAKMSDKIIAMKQIRAYVMTKKADAPAPAEYF